MGERGVLRIGEVARRTGVAVATLRAWETRYGLLDPTRTEGGHRLYSERDVVRVRAMQDLLEQGWSAGAAAREVQHRADDRRMAAATTGGDPAGELRARLRTAIDGFDGAGADAALDDTLARLDLTTALDEVVMPVLHWVAEGWQDDPRVIAREHFASNALRPRLLRLLRTSLSSAGRAVVAATPEREEHDLGLLAASAVAAEGGWNVHFLGARTPTAAIERAAEQLQARLVLVGAVFRQHATAFLEEAVDLGPAAVVLGGAGFEASDAGRLRGAVVHTGSYRDLPGVLRTAAETVRS